MRKLSLVLIIVLSLAMLSACGSKNENPPKDSTENQTTVESTSEENVVRIGVDKNNLADPEGFLDSMKDYGAEVTDLTNAGGYLFVFSKDEVVTFIEKLKEIEPSSVKEFNENYIDDISAQGQQLLSVIKDITEDKILF